MNNPSRKFRAPGFRPARGALLMALCTAMYGSLMASEPPLGAPVISDTSITWPAFEQRSLLTVSGPDGISFTKEFAAGESPQFVLDGLGDLPDYSEINYSLNLLSDMDINEVQRLVDLGEAEVSDITLMKRQIQREEITQTGGWSIIDGSLVTSGARIKAPSGDSRLTTEKFKGTPGSSTPQATFTDEDITIESTDVDLFLRDTTNGTEMAHYNISIDEAGLNDLAFQTDQNGVNSGDGAVYPLVIKNSITTASDDAIVIDSTGDVGFGTNVPRHPIHIADESPAIRFQDNSGVTRTWDLLAYSTEFVITTDAKKILTLSPNAPSNSLVVGSGGVGMGTGSPVSPLHILREDDTLEFLTLESTQAGAAQDRAMMYLQNNGGIRFEFRDTNQENGWRFQSQTGGNDRFEITKVGTGEIELDLRQSGNLRIKGNLFTNSDVNSKQEIVPVDGFSVLSRLDELPVSEWSYKDEVKIRHLGPMAQDFHATFGLGEDETSIAPMDLAGVSLAAVKALNQKLDQENQGLRERLETLEAQIATLLERL